MSTNIQIVRQAINALYFSNDSDERHRADVWLQELQRKVCCCYNSESQIIMLLLSYIILCLIYQVDAWSVADQLLWLTDATANERYFAATTLHIKVL